MHNPSKVEISRKLKRISDQAVFNAECEGYPCNTLLFVYFTGQGFTQGSGGTVNIAWKNAKGSLVDMFPLEDELRKIASRNPYLYIVALFDCPVEQYSLGGNIAVNPLSLTGDSIDMQTLPTQKPARPVLREAPSSESNQEVQEMSGALMHRPSLQS